jgi:hypothetical protein
VDHYLQGVIYEYLGLGMSGSMENAVVPAGTPD